MDISVLLPILPKIGYFAGLIYSVVSIKIWKEGEVSEEKKIKGEKKEITETVKRKAIMEVVKFYVFLLISFLFLIISLLAEVCKRIPTFFCNSISLLSNTMVSYSLLFLYFSIAFLIFGEFSVKYLISSLFFLSIAIVLLGLSLGWAYFYGLFTLENIFKNPVGWFMVIYFLVLFSAALLKKEKEGEKK